jgi:hypothetical protein
MFLFGPRYCGKFSKALPALLGFMMLVLIPTIGQAKHPNIAKHEPSTGDPIGGEKADE